MPTPLRRTRGAREPGRSRLPGTAAVCWLFALWIALGAGNVAPARAQDPAPAVCTGDCDASSEVTPAEVEAGIPLIFGSEPLLTCGASAFVRKGRDYVSAADLVGAAINAEAGCDEPHLLGVPQIYRTHPGFDVARKIDAMDPLGQPLVFTAPALLAGAMLDETSGIFTWNPSPSQIGPKYNPFTVTDTATPPLSSDGNLVFKVSPVDSCTLPICDPATGCEDTLVAPDISCCSQEPQVRVEEPSADWVGCPGSLVAFLGRNEQSGFGRMQNCDRLRAASFAQSGTFIRFRIEARCINANLPVQVSARLSLSDRILSFESITVFFQYGDGGFARSVGGHVCPDGLCSFQIRGVPLNSLEGLQGNLLVTLLDGTNTRVSTQLRVWLTTQELGDLPETP